MTKAPKRAVEITIVVGADNIDIAVAEVQRIAAHVSEHGTDCRMVSGGCDSGSYVMIAYDPTMTPERYVEALGAYLDECRKEETKP